MQGSRHTGVEICDEAADEIERRLRMLWDPSKDIEVKPQVDAVGQILLDAAAYIEQHGWCKGRMDDSDGRACALGAVRRVAGMTGADGAATSIAIMRLAAYLRSPMIGVWNDAQDSMEAVTSVLRKAAVSC